MAWEPGSPEYESWRANEARKTNQAAPGFDIFGMPLPAPAPPPAPAGPAAPPAPDRRDAEAVFRLYLERLGIAGEAQWGYDLIARDAPMSQLELELRDRPGYKARFPYMEALAKKGRAIDERTAIELERRFFGIADAFKLPEGVVGREQVNAWIAGEVAPTEVADRVELAVGAVFNEPPETLAEMSRLYGDVGRGIGAAAAYFLDRERALPLLQRQLRSASLAGVARRTGYGTLGREEAERLVGLGVTPEAAAKGFGELSRSSELFSSLDAGEDTIDRATGQAAVFEGNAAAIAKLNERAERRRAQFSGGGGFAAGREGISGLASAAR